MIQWLTDGFVKYYGVDWLIFLLVALHIELLARKSRRAFVLGFVASAVSVCFGIMIGSVANVVMNVCFMCFHIRAWNLWRE